jgi:hypothetical protein
MRQSAPALDGKPQEARRNDALARPTWAGGNRLGFRNKFPRPAGQGLSKQVYGLLGISGSQTGGQGVIDISLPELVQSGQTGITSTWPLNIPGAGSQTQYRLNVPSGGGFAG